MGSNGNPPKPSHKPTSVPPPRKSSQSSQSSGVPNEVEDDGFIKSMALGYALNDGLIGGIIGGIIGGNIVGGVVGDVLNTSDDSGSSSSDD